MTSSLRPVGTPPRIVGRAPATYAQELQEFLERLLAKVMGGIPSGFGGVDAESIEAGDLSTAGNESSGWAAADHTHGISTGTPSNITLSVAAAEGSSLAFSRADHVHGTNTLSTELIAAIEDEAYLSWVM